MEVLTTRSRFFLLVPLVVVLALFATLLFRVKPSASIGRRAPEFSLRSLEGSGLLGPSNFRGKPLVINFWASWCEPCKDEAPEFALVSSSTPEVPFLGVNILDGRSEARAFVRRYGIGYPSVRDASGRVSKIYVVTGVPETVFVDPSGQVVGKFIGAFPPGKLAAIVADLQELRDGEVLTITGRGQTKPVP